MFIVSFSFWSSILNSCPLCLQFTYPMYKVLLAKTMIQSLHFSSLIFNLFSKVLLAKTSTGDLELLAILLSSPHSSTHLVTQVKTVFKHLEKVLDFLKLTASCELLSFLNSSRHSSAEPFLYNFLFSLISISPRRAQNFASSLPRCMSVSFTF